MPGVGPLDRGLVGHGLLLAAGSLVLASASDHWALVLRGRNLTDERVRDLVFDSSVFENTYVAQSTAERTASVTLRVNF